MILRLSNPAARIALLFVAVALAAVLAYSSVRSALAENAIRLGTRAGYERSVKVDADNPVIWYLLGRYWQYNLEEIDNLRAIEAYRTALSLDPRSADSWLDLASAYEVQNDTAAASDAYQQAKRVYPLSAEVSWRYGNFLLRTGNLRQAFAEVRRSLSVEPIRAAEAFSRFWRASPNIETILDEALPPTGPVYLYAIGELIADAQVVPALTARCYLRAVQKTLAVSGRRPYRFPKFLQSMILLAP